MKCTLCGEEWNSKDIYALDVSKSPVTIHLVDICPDCDRILSGVYNPDKEYYERLEKEMETLKKEKLKKVL
jgi:hypothetical protein